MTDEPMATAGRSPDEPDYAYEKDLNGFYPLVQQLERQPQKVCGDAAKVMRALISEVDFLRALVRRLEAKRAEP